MAIIHALAAAWIVKNSIMNANVGLLNSGNSCSLPNPSRPQRPKMTVAWTISLAGIAGNFI